MENSYRYFISDGKSKIQSFFLRLFIVFIVHLICKHYDLTLNGAFERSFRSLLISVYFITFWMLFWQSCSIFYNRFIHYSADKKWWFKRIAVLSFFLLIYQVICSLIFSRIYILGDYYLFGTEIKDIHFINPEVLHSPDTLERFYVNPEMFFGLMLFFILVYGFHVFITFIRNILELEIVTAKQKKESITAQYSALKNQIDPHFFFNSLSVLSSLIYESTELSASYISHLSKHYRYILEMNGDNLVSLDEELKYLESYFFLIKMRHQDCIRLRISMSEADRKEIKIIPHSLQMLVENAVKHNTFRTDNPLIVDILQNDDYIIIRNNLNKRKLLQESTGIGLNNIINRYAIEVNRDVMVEEDEQFFTVKLPKIAQIQ